MASMVVPFVDLKAQYQAIRKELDEAIAAVIDQTMFIGNGSNKYVTAFEEAFARFVGVEHCIACGNGTDALEILLKAAGVTIGDEVVVPAVTWIASAEAATNVGARPVFVDIDASTYTLDTRLIEKKISPATKAIIPVHLYGLPADMDPIMEVASRHGLFVLEDCAQAHGARYRGRSVGSIGHAGAFSFFPSKNLGAYGDAGGMVTNNQELALKARMIAQHGQLKTKYDHIIEGRNSRMDGLQAAILSVKLSYLGRWTEARRRHAEAYMGLLKDLPVELPCVPEYADHVFHMFPIQCQDRDRVADGLQSRKVSCGKQYPTALPFVTAYAQRSPSRKVDFPVSVGFTSRVLTLPMYAELGPDQIQHVRSTLADLLTTGHIAM